jgi:hypothetical protein
LSFYFKYIAGLKEPDQVLEEIDPPTFGNLFHNTLEDLYKPFVGKILEREDLEIIRKDKDLIETKLKTAFRDTYFKTPKNKEVQISGRNLLIFDILKKYIDRILILDQQFAPFQILSLEDEYRIQIPISGDRKVNIKGLIDRVDRANGTIRILDYKTGKADLFFKDIESLFEKEGKNRNKAAFQTLLYCLFYEDKTKAAEAISPGVYSLKEFFHNNFACMLARKEGRAKPEPVDDYRVYKEEFTNALQEMLEEIFDPKIPFDQVENQDACRTCLYAEICHR